jgi:ELWxxDGT repeat protein
MLVPLGAGKAILLETSLNSLWVTDATSGGTLKLSDTIVYDGAGGLLNGQFVFAASSPTFGSELWITDGTVAGTRLLKDINPGKPGAEPQDDFVLLNGFLYFSASTPNEGREIWRTNGTEAGTSLVKDIVPGPAGSALKGRYDLFSNGSYLLFSCVADAATGYELWRSDGTEPGTFLLKDINPNGASSTPSAFQVYNGSVLFWAETAAEGRELWRTDGTTGGTQLVKDIRTGPASSVNTGFPMPTIPVLYPFKNRLLFTADDGISGEELWTTDGTTAGTYQLKDINTGADRSYVSLPTSVALGGKLYFAAYQPGSGSELWETDGTTAGTKIFKEILPGMDGGIPFLLPNLKFDVAQGWPVHQGSFFYFMFGLPADGGVELWKSDGTDAGTVKVKTIKSTDSDFGNLSYVYTSAGLYFSVDDGVHSDELWKSDGTANGTSLLMDLNPNAGEGSEISFIPFTINNKYLFTASNGDNAFQWDLYRLDGDFATLPIRMGEFIVRKQGVDALLLWTTIQEENSKDFLVQRSTDGIHYVTIGTVPAAGNSATKKSYSFTDKQTPAHAGIVYYRLVLQDNDGKKENSTVRTINLKAEKGWTVQINGNPVREQVNVVLAGIEKQASVQVHDASGKVVKTVTVAPNVSRLNIDLPELKAGVYFLNVVAGDEKKTIRFMKQ